MTNRHAWLAVTLWLAACGSSIEPDEETDDVTEEPGASDEVEIDASADGKWVHFDLESGQVVASSSRAWDLAFKRFHVEMNGGVSGTGGVEVALLKDRALDAVTEAPAAGYATDVADGADEDKEPDYFMSTGETGWWNYEPTNHTLSPRKHVYVVRTAEGALYKLAIVKYYNEAGSSGYPRIRFAQLAAAPGDGDGDGDGESDAGVAPTTDAGEPDSSADDAAMPAGYETYTVAASANDSWVRVKVGEGVVTADAASTGWDLAFQRTMIQTNSGTSGTGQGGARLLDGDFTATLDVPTTEGFEVDAMLPLPGPPGSGEFSGNPSLNGWYDYDGATHAVSPKPVAFLVRTAAGDYAKLRISAWSDGVYTIDVGTLGE